MIPPVLPENHPSVQTWIPDNPYTPRDPHFETEAKQVLIIFCPGAVSHVDTFDYKPDLTKYHGQKPPGMPAVTFEGPSGNIAKPFWDFKPRGKSGKMVSELVPHLGAWLMISASFTLFIPRQVPIHRGRTFLILDLQWKDFLLLVHGQLMLLVQRMRNFLLLWRSTIHAARPGPAKIILETAFYRLLFRELILMPRIPR